MIIHISYEGESHWCSGWHAGLWHPSKRVRTPEYYSKKRYRPTYNLAMG